MLKVNIVCVGSIKEKFYVDAINEYKKRLSRFCSLTITEVNELSEQSLNKKIDLESQSLLKAVKGQMFVLDRCGKELSSPEMAQLIKKTADSGTGEISFVIGGSNGVSQDLISKANQSISFGKITFPHQLFRVVLLEQIYRAFSILNNSPYHK